MREKNGDSFLKKNYLYFFYLEVVEECLVDVRKSRHYSTTS